MENNGWNKTNKHSSARVSPKIPRSPATDYFHPSLKHVGVKIISDEPDFLPVCEEGSHSASVFANIPSSELVLEANSSFVMDCGFEIELPAGYRCRAESLIPSIFVSILDSKRFKLNLFNAGEKTVLIHKQSVAKLLIEPIYLFEWIVEGKNE